VINMSKQNKNPNLLTLKESREIIKSNLREMKRFEKLKREKKTPEQFTKRFISRRLLFMISRLSLRVSKFGFLF